MPGGVDDALPAGPNEVAWSARGLAPGIYLARLTDGRRSATLRLVRAK